MSLFWKILVFDEGTESADIATNENILFYSRGIEGEKRTRPRFADWFRQQVRRYFDHVIENGNDGHVILVLIFKRWQRRGGA
jgi:hypothetical protein